MNGLRMLLVDDDQLRGARRQRAFERHGFEVTCVASRAEALEILRAGQVCEMAVIDLRAGAGRAVALVNALRGLRAWMPAVIIGAEAEPPGAVLMDPGVRTLFVPETTSVLAISSAVMRACCPGRLPDYCPFQVLVGALRMPHPAPAGQGLALAG